MIEYNKALASAGSKSKFILLGAILILWRRMTLHKLKPMVLLRGLICCILCGILGVRTEKHIVDTSTEEPVAYRKEDEYLRGNERHEYSPEYHVSVAEFYIVECLTKLVATHHVTEVLHAKPINGSHESICSVETVLIVRVPVILINHTLSTALAMVVGQLDACGGPSVLNNKTNTEGVL